MPFFPCFLASSTHHHHQTLSLSLLTMGKGKKHNKLYITQSEWKNEFGGKRTDGLADESKGNKPLPFHCCALALTPFETPVCTPDGIIYEITYAIR
jgi:hypothetical protein